MQRKNANNNDNLNNNNCAENIGINTLPLEMWAGIFKEIGFKDFYRSQSTCRLFKDATDTVQNSASKILTFIRCTKKEVTEIDKSFANAIEKQSDLGTDYMDLLIAELSSREGYPTNLVRFTLLKYLQTQNYFILCRDFFAIPEVKQYMQVHLTSFVQGLISLSMLDNVGLNVKNKAPGKILQLELSLIACLTANAVESSNEEISPDSMQKVANVLAQYTPNPTSSKGKTPTCAADLYELCRYFVIKNYKDINPKLISQFYNCYINCLWKDPSQANAKKNRELVTEKLELLKKIEEIPTLSRRI